MRRLQLAIVVALAIGGSALAGGPPAAALGAAPAPAVSDAVRYKVLAGYQKAKRIEADYNAYVAALCSATPDCVAKRDTLNAAISAYNTAIPTWAAEAGLPKGSVLVVDDVKDTVSAVVPPAPPAPSAKEAAPNK
jgi:hypothetical protein